MATASQQAHASASSAAATSRIPANGQAPQSEAVQTRRDLTSWWKGFKRSNAKSEEPKAPAGIFGVPLQDSIRYANVAISLLNDEGQSYIYGYVPIVVAKCGVFLKEKATETEGIFRLAGSEKRIKELKNAFDSPERYGKGLDWTGYTVHDAANVLRRYFNQLPEPIIPLTFYERFRVPLKGHQPAAVGSPESIESPDSFDADRAIHAYQALITVLPPLNRQLLLYILDLLAVFASKSDTNKMNTPNLAAIFQPGILSHPQHDMAPQEYRLSQDVLIFLIENQDHFLIGMHGTAVDEKTVQDVQSGYQRQQTPVDAQTTPLRSKTVLQRSSSNASGASQRTRKFSGLRRNVSTSSRTSSIPNSPQTASPAMSGGVYRSNTVPSQRHASSPRFTGRDKTPDPPTPSPKVASPTEYATVHEVPEPEPADTPTPLAQPPTILDITSASSSEATTPVAAPGSDTSSAILIPKNRSEAEDRPALLTPEAALRDTVHERASSRSFRDIFKQSTSTEQEPRTPRKLQKKRAPGGSLSSAHSSVNDLHHEQTNESLGSPNTPHYAEYDGSSEAYTEASPSFGLRAMSKDSGPNRRTSDGLLPGSPYMSERSRASVTDISDAEGLEDNTTSEKQERKKRWRFSHSVRPKQSDVSTTESARSGVVVPITTAVSPDASRVGSGSSTSQVQTDSAQTPMTESTVATEISSAPVAESDEKKKGPISWIRGKMHNKDKDRDTAEKRSKSPVPAADASGDSLAAPSTSDDPAGTETPTPTPSTAKMESVVEAISAEDPQTAGAQR